MFCRAIDGAARYNHDKADVLPKSIVLANMETNLIYPKPELYVYLL